jgi:hypothetical protein
MVLSWLLMPLICWLMLLVSGVSAGIFDITATMNEETHGKDVQKTIKGRVLPYTLTAKLTAPLFEESLDARGDIKLNQSK